ncbi:WD40/YVTN/BNR-like repeat-containing protein [Nannocystis punicea]|uniref:Photosynthesis system II assembly factor Ycf48/Hcf136-like domain-containing protein n=1 Tax=Nannocystis punicea TaxID=2995304 RepID=A0ABY7HJ48_9BACT|nr:hypothetical protein [Nannocystis poenicansa]WAS99360.1 hypothetical protein O0S08_24800 [Nannocystis poenicansa]
MRFSARTLPRTILAATARSLEAAAWLGAACIGLAPGCGDECVGWTDIAVDPRIRRFEAGIQIGTDAAIFADFAEVGHADARLRALAMSPATFDDFAVVGDAGTIRYSRDGGETWSAPSSPPLAEDLFGVRYSCEDDALYVIAVGAAGRILRSTTGGASWTPAESSTSLALRDVAIVHPDTVVAVGDGGTIVRSTDRGITWQSVASGTREDLRSLALEDCAAQLGPNHPIRGLAVGDAGTVLLSHDGGASWSPIQSELAGDLLQVQIGTSSVDQWKIHALLLDSGHLWRWREDSGALEQVHAFDAPVHWFSGVSGGGMQVLGEGALHTYRSAKQCADD